MPISWGDIHGYLLLSTMGRRRAYPNRRSLDDGCRGGSSARL